MPHVKTSDFLYMWQGKPKHPLPPEDAHYLSPINIHNKNHHRALLLLHGFSSSPAVYRQLLPTLTGYDAFVCPTLPGHGTNLTDFANVNASDWLFSVESICNDLIQRYEHVDVMGLSLGGLLAYHAAQRLPIHHLYLLAPALFITLNIRWTQYLIRMLQCLGIKNIRNHAGTIRDTTNWELTYRRLPLHTVNELLTLINTFNLTPPTCPMDVFLGRHDPVVDVSSLAIHFNGLPHATLHWLEDSSHVLPLDTDMQAITACVNKNTPP